MKKTDLREVSCIAQLSAVEDAIYVLGGKWKLSIMIAVVNGYHRFNELQRTINGISARVLSMELKSLELNGLVKRVVNADQTPVVVGYLPSEYAAALKEKITVLANWGRAIREGLQGGVRRLLLKKTNESVCQQVFSLVGHIL